MLGFHDCPDTGKSIGADIADEQVGQLIQSLKLLLDWEQVVRKMRQDQQNGPDPDTERREIRATLGLTRENFEIRLHEGEEFLYWQKVNSLQERLGLLNRVPENAITRAAHTLLDLRET